MAEKIPAEDGGGIAYHERAVRWMARDYKAVTELNVRARIENSVRLARQLQFSYPLLPLLRKGEDLAKDRGRLITRFGTRKSKLLKERLNPILPGGDSSGVPLPSAEGETENTDSTPHRHGRPRYPLNVRQEESINARKGEHHSSRKLRAVW